MQIHKGKQVSAFLEKRKKSLSAGNKDVRKSVAEILGDVLKNKDRALIKYAKKFDGVTLKKEELRVPDKFFKNAYASVNKDFLKTLEKIRGNIEKFQKREMQSLAHKIKKDKKTFSYVVPVENVGVHVPGGGGAYPSTLLMTVVPAQVAGVKNIFVVSPPTARGSENSYTLATAHFLGVKNIFRCGGAQSIGALAYGTETIPKVDMICGPGNAYVTEAKRQVFGAVNIDLLAGPTELVVVADDSARADFVASDLLSQAEHGANSFVALVTPSEKLVLRVLFEVRAQLKHFAQKDTMLKSLTKYAAVLVTKNLQEAVSIANDIAPEHLSLQTKHAGKILKDIRHAGCIFVGNYSPVALGDYFAGPSHVLPTGRSARFFSPLSSLSFLKTRNVISYSKVDLEKSMPYIKTIAEAETFSAHAASVERRFRLQGAGSREQGKEKRKNV